MPKINSLSEFEYLLTKVTDLHFEETGKKLDPKWKKFLNRGDTSEADFRSSTTVGFGQHKLFAEGQKVSYDTFKKGTERVTTWKNFGLGYRATKNLVEDMEQNSRIRKDTVKIFKNLQTRLRKSANWTQETIAANVMLKADIAVADDLWPGAGRDALALASANHKTSKFIIVFWSNRQTSTTLSSIALQEQFTMLHTQPDEVGMPGGPAESVNIVLPTYWEWRWEEISNTRQALDSNINNPDALNKAKKGMTMILNEHLGATFAGWMLQDKEEHMLESYERQEPKMDSDRDFGTKGLLFSCDFRFSVDHQSPRHTEFNMG